MMPLPEDIIYAILDELATDPATLKQCSLVSRVFLQHCHKILFYSISLRRPVQCRSLYAAISNNASLASYVHTIQVIGFLPRDFSFRDWLTLEHTLAPLLQTLHNLQSFVLLDHRHTPLPWTMLPAALRSTVFDLSSPSIHLENIANVPMGYFGRMVHTKHLELINVFVDGWYSLDLSMLGTAVSNRGPYGYLESLLIHDSSTSGGHLVNALTDPRSRLSLRHLRKLVLQGNHGFEGRIMEVAGGSLEHVVWTGLGEEKEGPYRTFPSSFGSLPNLHTLSINTKFARGHAHDPLPLLAHALSQATPSDACSLTTLKIGVDFYGVWKFSITTRDANAVSDYAFWPKLDQALTRPGVFTKMRNVTIGLNVGSGGEAFSQLPVRRLPGLLEMDVLHMIFTDK